MSDQHEGNFFYNIEKSAVITFVGILFLFSGAVIVTLIAPSMVDPTWTQPTSDYQVQMYEVADPHLYRSAPLGGALQQVHHLKQGYSLLAFQESETIRIHAPPELDKYVSRKSDSNLKLTSELLLLREAPENDSSIQAFERKLQEEWQKAHPEANKEEKTEFIILDLYRPKQQEAFARAPSDTVLENWVDQNFTILDDSKQQQWHNPKGVIYVSNPVEYRITYFKTARGMGWKYDHKGEKVENLTVLQDAPLGFKSRQHLIAEGEHVFATEGCWYCHTDQTRTLIQDVVLNGSAAFPAPPSSANEYIYDTISFAGTRRIGPDISRVGIKRPSRDWHKAHFWAPKTASKGSIMPAFQHFFDFDPRGTSPYRPGVPNRKFEAVFQYLMTKGTRITPPTQAWWLGLDPIDTKAIIEGRKILP